MSNICMDFYFNGHSKVYKQCDIVKYNYSRDLECNSVRSSPTSTSLCILQMEIYTSYYAGYNWNFVCKTHMHEDKRYVT